MPDPRLVAQIAANSGIYDNWLSLAVTYSYADTNPIRHFNFTCAEPSSVEKAMVLVPGDRVDVILAGKRVIEKGFIKVRQAGYDANRHAVQVSGLSQAGNMQQASADPGQYRGYTFQAIANKIAQKHGVKFRMVNPPKGADLPFPNVIPAWGETDWQFLSKLARARGIMLSADPNGDLVGGVPDGGDGAVLREGQNIFSCNAYIEFPWADLVVGGAQEPGSDEKSGRKVSEVQAQSVIKPGATGLTARVMAERPLGEKENQIATDAYAADLLLATVRVTVSHPGWFKPATSDLWQLGDKVMVYSPMAFGRVKSMDLRVYTVTCTQTPEGQTLTTLELVSDAVFTKRFPDGQADNPLTPSAEKATPSPVAV